MGFANSSRHQLGKHLHVKPIYGWGWSRLSIAEPALSFAEAAGPATFRIRLLGLFESEGTIRDASARVEEPGHVCDGWFVAFSTRGQGEFDFDRQIAQCNILVGPEFKDGAPLGVGGPGALGGFAEISANMPNQSPDPEFSSGTPRAGHQPRHR